jgi:hypothetical protein
MRIAAKTAASHDYVSIGVKHKKPIWRISKTGEKVRYDGIVEACQDGFNRTHISNCCHGKRKTSGGYAWEFVDQAI